MNAFVQILGCDGTVLYETDGRQAIFNTSGRLEVYVAYDGMIMIRLNSFEYSIRKSEEIICDKNDPQFKMILYLKKYPKGNWILKINENVDEVYSCLGEKCHIIDRSEQQKQFSAKIENSQKKDYSYQKVQEDKQVDNHELLKNQDNSKTTVGTVLVGASKGIGWGFKMTGKVLSKGFEAVGSLASKAVAPAAQKVQVSQSTKANLKLAKQTSKTVFGFAAAQVGNLFKFGKEAASNIGQRFEKSDKGRQLQENPKYETIKSGTKTGVQVVANIYDGVVNAVYDIGSGISKGTTKVISKKYGDDAGQAADQAFQSAGNVIKIARIPQDEAYKTFK